jgi:hypothetical protein
VPEQQPIHFIPTKAQWRFLDVFTSPDGPNTIKGCAERAAVNRRTVYDWFEDQRFCAWFYGHCDRRGKPERELMWRNTRKLAAAGSPEHIKLVAMKAGELIGTGTNDRMLQPASLGVFINVPRPPAELPAGTDHQQGEVIAADVLDESNSHAAALVTPHSETHND